MADSIASAWVEVLPDFSSFRRQIDSGLTSNLGQSGTRAGTIFGANFAASLASNAVFAIGDVVQQAVGAAITYAGDGIQLASDLGETVSAVNEIFGESADEIVDWASTAVNRLGQTRNQALNGIKTFGALGNAAGLTGSDLTGFSTSLVELATDLAAFNNTDVDTALNALRSGLSGEAEPLRQYQVFLNDAALKQKALELGIYDGSGALSDQQRILSAYNLVLERTQLQQGNFALTSGDLAGQQKILEAALVESQTALGEYLLPGFTSVVTYANENLLPKLGEVIDRVGPQFAEAFEESGPALEGLADSVLTLADNVGAWAADGGVESFLGTLQDIADLAEDIGGFLDWGFDPDQFYDPSEAGRDFRNSVETAFEDFFGGSDGEGGVLSNGSDFLTAGEEAGERFADGLVLGLDGQSIAANQAGERLTESAIDGATESQPGWVLAGQDAVDGFTRGISDRTATAASVAAGMAESTLGAIRKVLRIESPSKAMAELGAYTVEGFYQGWEAGIRPLVIPELADSFAPVVPSVGGSEGGDRVREVVIQANGVDPLVVAQMIKHEMASASVGRKP